MLYLNAAHRTRALRSARSIPTQSIPGPLLITTFATESAVDPELPATGSRKTLGGIQTDGGPWMCDSCPPCHANAIADRRESAGGADKQAHELDESGSLGPRMEGWAGRGRCHGPRCAWGAQWLIFLVRPALRRSLAALRAPICGGGGSSVRVRVPRRRARWAGGVAWRRGCGASGEGRGAHLCFLLFEPAPFLCGLFALERYLLPSSIHLGCSESD